jgi:Cu-Zn family superoxide dismutase
MAMKRILMLVLVVLMLAALAATAVAARNTGALHASATLVDPAGNVVGEAKFTEDAAGRLHVTVKVDGISPGLHGIHLHAVGSCTPDFGAAGGHHNPLGRQHGLHNPNGAHSGDLPNLVVNGAGQGHLNAFSDRAALSPGPTTLFDANGSSLIIHAGEDDQVTDPTGNSGGRIACGVITLD